MHCLVQYVANIKNKEHGDKFLEFLFDGALAKGSFATTLLQLQTSSRWDSLIQPLAESGFDTTLSTEQFARQKIEDLHYSESIKPITPSQFVGCCLYALAIAAVLNRASGVYHHLAVSRVTPAQRSCRLLKVATWILVRLRRWQERLGSLPKPAETADPAGASTVNLYSEQIHRFLRREIDRTELETAFRSAVDAFALANPWSDSEKRRPRRNYARDESDTTHRARVFARCPENGFLERAGDQARQLHEMARRLVFEDQGLFNLYRARSLMLQARVDYLGGEDFEGSLGRIARAGRLLDEGRVDSPLDLVAVWRARAECLMLNADVILARSQSGTEISRTWDAWEQNWSFATHQLLQARDSLNVALRHFQHRWRNIPWWLRLSRELAQWSIEAAVLNIVGFPLWNSLSEFDRPQIAKFEEILELGLSSVRASLDAVLRTNDPGGVFTQKFVKASRIECQRSAGQWLCLMAATYWHDFINYQFLASQQSNMEQLREDRGFSELFWERWKSVNNVYRFPNLVDDKEKDNIWTFIMPLLPTDTRRHNLWTTVHDAWKRRASESVASDETEYGPLNVAGSTRRTSGHRFDGEFGPSSWIGLRSVVLDLMILLTQSEKLMDKLLTAMMSGK
jgi:hypothetical protein